MALPSPIHVEAIPYFQPNCPAYPTKTTAEKYDVPYANAVIHGPADLEPNTNPLTSVACFLVYTPIPIMTAKNTINNKTLTNILFLHF